MNVPDRHEVESPQRGKILHAAAEVFAEHGFAGAGVDEIARHAGVNKAMLYYHVGDKARLYAEVVISFITEVQSEIHAAVAEAPTPLEKLAAFQHAFMSVALARPEMPRIMLREISMGGAGLPAEATRKMAQLLATTREIVAAGKASGDFRDVDPVITHILVIGSVAFFANALRMRDRLHEEGAQLPELHEVSTAAEKITDILLYGLAARPAGGGRP